MGALIAGNRGPGGIPRVLPPEPPRWQGRPGRGARQTFLELGALPTAVPCARLHVRQILWEWGHAALAEIVELVVSELVTNAVRAAAGLTGSRYAGRWVPGTPPVRLWVASGPEIIVVQVWDGNHQLPGVQDVALDAESGRGLLLVETLSSGWGCYLAENSSGKVVWAAIAG